MQRYFFHLTSKETCTRDERGELLSGLNEAIKVGQQTALELSRNVDHATLIGKSIVVNDESGTTLFEFPLTDSWCLEAYGSGDRSSSRFYN